MDKIFKWYAVYTMPRWEKKVAGLLNRQEIENYCPLVKVQRQWSDRKKIILEPIFRSYVFVHLENAEMPKVKQTCGVLNFVSWLAKPAVIRDEEITLIKQFLNDHEHVKLEKYNLKVNDRVRINSGPFRFQNGNITEVRSNAIKIVLPSLGYQIIAEIKHTHIELLKF